ncbi:MAG: (2Fe-2S)-binding protein [Verrucomicrobiaceae bacterium]|nr:(2Fe-2S)-binding protein [Verrucomicrobiaceae bacterium]
MIDERTARVYEGVEREVNRKTYPESFPALPEVPVGRYTDPQFYDLEMKHFWRRTWLHAGHVSQIPEPGSFKLFSHLGLSIIISRDSEGEIHAFHNVCRHRGAALVTASQGTTRRFICPYHSWSYGLDGRLLGVPEERNFACINKAERPLVQVRCETMRGMIFVNLDNNALPLTEYFAATERELGDFPLEKMIVKDVITIEMGCNWKAAYDNFLEIYHVNTVHAKSIAPFLDSRSFLISLYKHGHARFATRKRGASTIFGTDLEIPEGPSALFKDHTIGLPMFPNNFIAIDPVAFGWQSWWPTSLGNSVMEFTLMGWENQSGVDDSPFWADMNKQVHAIAGEDLHLFGDLQRNLESGVLKGVLMGYQEQALYWYQEEIDRQIGIENIPEHLRIQQVLAAVAQD